MITSKLGCSEMGQRWYHVTFSTYGTWLPGDSRGFRTRHHREHVEGDYKSPPRAGIYEKRHLKSAELLNTTPRKLNTQERKLILLALINHLTLKGAILAAAAVGAKHVHVILKFNPPGIRRVVGDAKKHAWHVLHNNGLSGRLWAKRSRAEPIRNREHQLNAVRYVLRHRKDGAAVWRFGDPVPS